MRIDEKRLDLGPAVDDASHAVAASVTLTSGSQLEFSAIMLYPAATVETMLELRVNAFALLEASPASLPALDEWAVTPALLVNAVNRGVSARKAAEAEDLLRRSDALAEECRSEGRFFDIAEIDGLDSPHPHHWVSAETVVEVQRKGLLGREIEQESEDRWIHNGEPFIAVRDAQGRRHDLRWAAVEQYRLIDADA